MWSPPDAAPPPAACAAVIRSVEGAASVAAVPAGCWRVGPLVIGMKPAQAEARIGAPDERFALTSDDAAPRRYVAAAYLFPHGLDARLRRRPAATLPALKLLGLLYAQGRLVRIDTAQGYGLSSERCPDGRPQPTDGKTPDTTPREFAPFTRFATVAAGELIEEAANRLGRDFTVSTARDFRAFTPAPITLDGDTRLRGFSVSGDTLAEFQGFTPRLVLSRRAGDCRIDGVRFEAQTR